MMAVILHVRCAAYPDIAEPAAGRGATAAAIAGDVTGRRPSPGVAVSTARMAASGPGRAHLDMEACGGPVRPGSLPATAELPGAEDPARHIH